MKNWCFVLCFVLFLAIPASAQTTSETRAPSPGISLARLEGGTAVVAELSRSLNTKKAKVGDIVKAVVAQDVLVHGRVVIRAGSMLFGRLTLVKASSRGDRGSRLGIAFEKVSLKGGGELSLRAQLRALGPPALRHSRVDEPDQMLPPGYVFGPNPNAGGPASAVKTTTSSGARGGNQGSGSPSTGSSSAGSRIDAGASRDEASQRKREDGRALSTQSRGVFWLPGLTISCAAERDCLITSQEEDVRLDSGSQVVVEAQGPQDD
jgi:hypothetical protein